MEISTEDSENVNPNVSEVVTKQPESESDVAIPSIQLSASTDTYVESDNVVLDQVQQQQVLSSSLNSNSHDNTESPLPSDLSAVDAESGTGALYITVVFFRSCTRCG